MACPFRFTICAIICIFAVLAAFAHLYLSAQTLDYLFTFFPIPHAIHSRIFAHLNGCDIQEAELHIKKQQLDAQQNKPNVPRIVKIVKYIVIIGLLYLHIEICYYLQTSKCLAASFIRQLPISN